jgi:hypothetical protein
MGTNISLSLRLSWVFCASSDDAEQAMAVTYGDQPHPRMTGTSAHPTLLR